MERKIHAGKALFSIFVLLILSLIVSNFADKVSYSDVAVAGYHMLIGFFVVFFIAGEKINK